MRIKHLTIVIIMTIINVMKRRSAYFVVCIASLSVGGALYLLCRENAYVTVFAELLLPLEKIRECLDIKNISFLNYYFPDFLWAFAFYFGAKVILYPKECEIAVAGAVFGFGVLWELLQYFGAVNGTGDIIDIFMYLTAVFTAVLIEKILKKRTK